MEFRTPVQLPKAPFGIAPFARILFAGSCFAEHIGRLLTLDKFRTQVNPFGVMYNPASVLHTVERSTFIPDVAVLTLGTNHVYILKKTGEIVDNCRKRPAKLFREAELSVEQCADYLLQAAQVLHSRNPEVKIIVTVSPVRYAKYGFPKSSLSKATLLLAAHRFVAQYGAAACYFPAYEILNDELRDYRFYAPDMLHPSEQAVEYIRERFDEMFLTTEAHRFLRDWAPLKAALAHRPLHPDTPEHLVFVAQTQQRLADLCLRYPPLCALM